ncbi:hypothetical protein A2U01_0048146, partial [Trifolium medium]|nr:hypothetical protein [Trifolium medium]
IVSSSRSRVFTTSQEDAGYISRLFDPNATL